jgi:hypothetical protein
VRLYSVVLQRDADQKWHDDKMVAEREKWVNLLTAVEEFLDIVNQSTGIDGWHMNGAILKWEQCDQILMLQESVASLREKAGK